MVIEPSILSADLARLGEQVLQAEAAGIEALQIDVMDGHFVPNITFGTGIVKAVRPLVKALLDVHLMITNPEPYLEVFVNAGANRLIVHQETCPHIHRTMQAIRALGVEAGVAINPGTPVSVLDEVLDLADVIQIMTVNPGFGGQDFIFSQLEKIKQLRQLLQQRNLSTRIAVDGGITSTTAPLVANAGATILVAGSSIFNSEASVAKNLEYLQTSLADIMVH
ncbi:MAG: ribulose-phosphate 3-epimerase [Anaerolineales bacterium]|nr:ribulose-phosphate 3-epimerase [Anaerolineales bacterium]